MEGKTLGTGSIGAFDKELAAGSVLSKNETARLPRIYGTLE